MSNIYAYHIGLGVSYGHGFKPVKIPENIFHDGWIIGDGVQGGTSDSIYCHWQIGAECDDDITQGINYQRCIKIKEWKKSATMTQKQRKARTLTIWATNLIIYDNALLTMSIFSQINPNLISVGMKEVRNNNLWWG